MTPIPAESPRLPVPVLVELPGAARDVVLDVLRYGPLPRSEVALHVGINPGHLTRIVQALMSSGLIAEVGEPRRNPHGRPSRPLGVVADAAHLVGVKLAGEYLHIVVTDLSSQIVYSRTRTYRGHDPAHAVERIAEVCREVERFHPMAIGVTMGAQVSDEWSVRVAPATGWRDLPFGAMIEKATGLPAIVSNDVVALTTVENWFGAGREVANFAVLTVGTAVGYGLVANGQVVQNADTGLGLINHERVSDLGGTCIRGHRGCAMTSLSFDGIERTMTDAIGRHVGFHEFVNLAASGEPTATKVMHDAGTSLGRLIASISALAMPDRILIAGEAMDLVDGNMPVIQATARSQRPPGASSLDIRVKHIEQAEWARGAAATAIERLLRP